jgi:hypothetical protein
MSQLAKIQHALSEHHSKASILQPPPTHLIMSNSSVDSLIKELESLPFTVKGGKFNTEVTKRTISLFGNKLRILRSPDLSDDAILIL